MSSDFPPATQKSGAPARRAAVALLVFAVAAIVVTEVTSGAAEIVPGPVPAQVIRVVDGDTILVRARIWLGQDVETDVRLAGVDAPEMKGHCPRERELAQRARDLVVSLVGDGPIRLHDVRRDKYGGRVVARVESASGSDVAAALRKAGLAHVYDGGTKQPWCESADAQ